MKRFSLLALASLVTLAGGACRQDMHDQPKAKPQSKSAFFVDGRTGRLPVEGTVARGDMLNFIDQVKANAQVTTGQLSDIMLAQDFHDLTGQTVRKVVDVAATLEESLVKLLLETTPPDQRPQFAATVHEGFLNGPAHDAAERTDVVTNQAQVDDLLESLGF